MRLLVGAGRALNAVFFLATTVYAILTYSPFAYEQFIQPNMIAWLSNFVFLHTDFYWLTLCVTVLTLTPQLKGGRGRLLAWAYLAASVAGGVILSVARVLPEGDTPARSVAVALVALVPIAWLGVIDRMASDARPTQGSGDSTRSLAHAVAAGVFVWAVFGAAVPSRLHAAGGIAASAATPQLLVGLAASLAAHVAAFTIAGLVVAAALGARVPVAVVTSVLFGVALHEVVLAPISVTGSVSWLLAESMAAAVVVGATGAARRLGSVDGGRWTLVARFAFAPVAAFVVVPLLTTFDWGFMLQKLTALLASFAVFSAGSDRGGAGGGGGGGGRPAPPPGPPPGPHPVFVAVAALGFYAVSVIAMPRLPAWLGDPRLQPAFALDAYSAADPSFRVLRQFLDADQTQPGDPAFYAYLRANSSIKDPLRPVSIDFARNMTPGSLTPRPPHIFLFIIDSLRRDYVSAYNPRVTFTPRLDAFARDSYLFTRAFSRYGGTGLAVPSIWAGALVAHKQYVTPFAPMNALAKLLDAGNYRRFVSRDHITEELFGLSDGTTPLDVRTDEMMHTFCGTLTELKDDLRTDAADPRPIFAHTRPLDLHIGNTRFATVPDGESYPGFFAPYAARVHRIDACFGDLVDDLKRSGLYDNSIIVVMADHGDSLGEGLRWGHGYTIVPEVIRIPLIVRVPVTLRDRYTVDASRLTFATDVTPSLYQLLGATPVRPRDAAGAPFVFAAGAEPPSRRRDAFLVASSYGAVYGIVRHNGRRLYIADAIEGRDAMYDLSPAAADARVGMTDAERQANRALMREQIDDLARWYGYTHP
jgi:Sulfatase